MLGYAENRIISAVSTNDLVLLISIPSNNTGFTIHFNYRSGFSSFDALINWGDNSPTTSVVGNTSTYKTHKYQAAGEYLISISGVCTNINFYGTAFAAYVLGVVNWGNVGLTNFYYTFFNCTNFHFMPDDVCYPADPPVTYVFSPFVGNNITRVVFPDYALLGSSMFQNCNNLQEIVIPETVTIIPSSFAAYSGLTTLTLHQYITDIGASAFYNPLNTLLEVICLATTPPILGIRVFYNGFYNFNPSLRIKVPAASVAAYKAATNWKTYSSIIVAI